MKRNHILRLMLYVFLFILIIIFSSFVVFADSADCNYSIKILSTEYDSEGQSCILNVQLTGDIKGSVVASQFDKSGKMQSIQVLEADQYISITFDQVVPDSYAKVMWLDSFFRPLCGRTRVELTHSTSDSNAEIFCNAIDEDHVAESVITTEEGLETLNYIDNEVLIYTNDGVERSEVDQLASSYNASIVGMVADIGFYQLSFEQVYSLDELKILMEKLENSDLIESAYLNEVSEVDMNSMSYPPNDPWDYPISPLWNEGYPDGNNWGAEAINALSAWKLLVDNKGDKIPSVRVGVIDSMFDMEHPDLVENIRHVWNYKKSVFLSPIDGDIRSITASKSSDDEVGFFHGSHVSGIIGATMDNKEGICGIAINPSLFCIALADKNGSIQTTNYLASNAGIIEGVSVIIESYEKEYEGKGKPKAVINFSQSDKFISDNFFTHSFSALESCLYKQLDEGRDFVIVTSAGNVDEDHPDGHDAKDNSGFNAITDGLLKDRIIVVGSASAYSPSNDREGFIADTHSINDHEQTFWMNYGTRIDVSAPGVDIWSTVPPSKESSKEYKLMTGTSQAAPHVAGTAALVWAADPSLSGDQVKKIILDTADIEVVVDDVPENHKYPDKMINAAHAVAEALGVEYVIGGDCGKNDAKVKWKLSDDKKCLTISGNGNMEDYKTEKYIPWYRYKNYITEVIIEDGITSVGDWSFFGMNQIKKVYLGSTLTKIGDYAFGGCSSLSEITDMPNMVISIGDNAFGSMGLKDIYFSGRPPKEVAVAIEDDNKTINVSASFSDKDSNPNNITLYYPMKYKDDWNENGDSLDAKGEGLWKGYHVKPIAIQVTGTVIDYDTLKWIEGAKVTVTANISDDTYTAETDEEGKFLVLIPGKAPATVEINVEAEGYQKGGTRDVVHEGETVLSRPMIRIGKLHTVGVNVTFPDGSPASGVAIKGTELDSDPVTDENGNVKFKIGSGDYELSVTSGDYSVSESVSITEDTTINLVLEQGIKGTISDSWEQIIENINNGTYKSKYNIGDTKELDLGSEGIVEMQIAAFDADELENGGTAAITWISKQLLKSAHRMNPSLKGNSSNGYILGTGSIGGWEHSEMRSWLQSDIKMLIPSTVRNAIKPVRKYCNSFDTARSYENDVVTVDDIWIPSCYEICGMEYCEGGGPMYTTLFSSDDDRIKYWYDTSYAGEWWMRSADYYGFCYVPNDGSILYWTGGSGWIHRNNANAEFGVTLGFCL